MEEEVPGPSHMSPPKKNPPGKTGIGRDTVCKTLAEYKTTGNVTSPNKKKRRLSILEKTSEEDLIAIRRKVHSFWLNREIPTLDKILDAINNDEELPSFKKTTLHTLLKCMEFKYIVRKRNSALIDEPRIVYWRQQYIERIRTLREEGRPIYYLDETWINAGDCKRRLWVDASVSCPRNAEERGLSIGIPAPTGRGKRLIILHVGSADGFVPGALLCFESKKDSADYHHEMNGDTFFEWFCKLLPMLRDGAVIVMDNAPYHSVRKDKYPTKSWTRDRIITWLEGKGEQVNPRNVKVQLLALVDKYRQPNIFVIDEYATEHGCTVVRLPPYHCELNPIELAWAKVKEFIRARNTTYKLADVRELVHEAIENVSTDNWQNFIRHAIKEEDRLHELDHITDSVLEENGELLETSDDSDIDV
ncbi:uncharacterized protein LOC143211640 [Lasioglossum baleicum]|uniref:uncharacterized protein LOC143211640 n=2 Tax=Lasioglossum baleicum TaxID=434251 RepID=UPI003FCCEA6E